METSYVFLSLVALLISLGLSLLVVQIKWIKYLRSHHNSAWVGLGRPSLINSMGTLVGVFRFIRTRKYLSFGDIELNRLTQLFAVLVILYGLVFIACILSGFITL